MGKTIHLLNKTLQLHQPGGGFQTSIDAVLLAAACPVEEGQTLLDLGCGVGAAGLCVLKRVPGVKLTGVELLEREAELARQNAALNGLKADIITTDIRTFPQSSSRRRPGSTVADDGNPGLRRDDVHLDDTVLFDHIICNPALPDRR